MPDLGPGTTGSQREQRALTVSIAAGAAFGVVAVTWGLLAQSQIILFDGVYSVLSLFLAVLSLRASQIVAQGPTRRYPFGRESLAPLVIGVQGIALLGTCTYAIVNAASSILDGGNEVSLGSAALYAVLSTVAAFVVFAYLRSYAKRSELVAAEAAQWLAGAVLSLGMLVAFVAVIALQGTAWEGVSRYVDPVLVIVACVAFIPTPVAMVRTTVRELLEGTPGGEVAEPVRVAVAEVSAAVGLENPIIRISKLGPKLYVEVDYLVEAGRWDVADTDRVRHALTERLEVMPYSIWLNVDLSTDPDWAYQ